MGGPWVCAAANCGGVTLITQQQMELQTRHQVMRYMAAWCGDHQKLRYFLFWVGDVSGSAVALQPMRQPRGMRAGKASNSALPHMVCDWNLLRQVLELQLRLDVWCREREREGVISEREEETSKWLGGELTSELSYEIGDALPDSCAFKALSRRTGLSAGEVMTPMAAICTGLSELFDGPAFESRGAKSGEEMGTMNSGRLRRRGARPRRQSSVKTRGAFFDETELGPFERIGKQVSYLARGELSSSRPAGVGRKRTVAGLRDLIG